MLLKIFRCRVAPARREPFLTEQRRWEALRSVGGFLAQCCGFAIDDSTACAVMALWSDRRSYERFMAGDHDRILGSGDQVSMYRDAEVTLAEPFVPQPAYVGDVVSDLAESTRVVLTESMEDVEDERSVEPLEPYPSLGAPATVIWEPCDAVGGRIATSFVSGSAPIDAGLPTIIAGRTRRTLVVPDPALTVRGA